MFNEYLTISPSLQTVIKDILIATIILFLGYFLLKVVKNILFRQLRKIVAKTATTLDDKIVEIIDKHIIPVGYFGLMYLIFVELKLDAILLGIFRIFFVVAATVCTSKFLIDLSRVIVHFYSEKYHHNSLMIERNINALFPALRVLIWSLAVVFILSNLGFDIAAIIAGLGIGGVALALASQGVLQDLFSYFAILFDRPCEIGDLISIDDFMGYVEHIGIKTTRIKALSGEQLILANTDLTSSRVRNFKRMQSRQIIMKLRVIYETDNDLLAQAPKIIEQAISPLENITFDLVYFTEFGDYSLDFEVIYYVHSNELRQYRLAKHRVNLALKRAFTEAGLEFAYPTQLNYLSSGSFRV